MTAMDARGRGADAAVEIEWLETIDSTNLELRRRFVDNDGAVAAGTTIATLAQTAGRGRLDREWIDTPGASLAMSTLVVFPADVAATSIGWVSLAAGMALRAALHTLAPTLNTSLKWPNDLLIDERKAAGILGEVVGITAGEAAFGCVVGIGLNLAATGAPAELPDATSLAEHGVEIDVVAVAETTVAELLHRIRSLIEHGGDAVASGLHAELEANLDTLGRGVRVTLASDETREGIAEGLEPDGRLRVRAHESGECFAVHVGDVTHLRAVTDASDLAPTPHDSAATSADTATPSDAATPTAGKENA